MQHNHKANTFPLSLLLYISFYILTCLPLLGQLASPDVPTTIDINEHYGSINTHFASVELDKSLVKTAETKLLDVLKSYPNFPARDLGIFLKAHIDLLNGNYHIAIKELEMFIKERGNSPFVSSALLFSGYIMFEAGNYTQAEYYFAQASKSAETDILDRTDKSHYNSIAHKSLYWQAISMCHQGRYNEAIPIFVQTQSNYPALEYAAQSLYALGSIAEMNKNYNNAIEYYEKIEKEYSYSNVILASMVRNANDKLLLRNPQSAALYIQKAETINKNIKEGKHFGDTNTSKTSYTKQDFNEHFDENVLYIKGETSNQVERYDLAIAQFKELLNSYPKSLLADFANMGIGWAYLNKSDYELAIKSFQAVIDSRLDYSPNDNISNIKAIAYLNKITSLKKLGRVEEAQNELSLLAVRPNFPQLAYVQLELSQIYYEKGDYELARKTLERAEREAATPKVLIRITSLLGASCLEVKQYMKAVESYKRTEQIAEKESYLNIPNKDWYLQDAYLRQGIALVLGQYSNDAIASLLKYIGTSADNSKSTNTSGHTDEALFWLAEAYYRSDMLKNSATTYGRVVSDYTSSRRREEALYGLGWSHFRMEQFTQSSDAFDKLVKEFPKSGFATEVLTRQADGYYRIKSYAKASSYYERAAKQGPGTEEGQYSAYQLAHTLYRQNKYEAAITASLSFVKNYPKSNIAPNALYLISWIRFQQEKYSDAIENFQFLIKTYPQSQLIPRSYFAIADAYYNMENYEEAINGYNVIIDQFPSNELVPEAISSIQQALVALDRDVDAIAIADKYITNNPNSPFVENFQYKKAEMFYTGRRYTDAVTEYSDFVNKYPESGKTPEALYWLGKSYAAVNDFDNASKVYLQMQKQFPKNNFAATGLLEYGLLLASQNMVDSAISIFNSIEIDFSENDAAPQAGFEKAILLFRISDTINAITQFKAVADKYPNTDFGDQSRYRVAMYYRFLGMNAEAIQEFSIIAEVYDNPVLAAEARYRMGELYIKMENRAEAKLCFELIRDKFAGYEDWYSLGMLGLGEIYEKEGYIDEAKDIYRTIVQLRELDEFGKTANQRLQRMK